MLGANAAGSEETEIIRRVTGSKDPLRDELLRGIPNEVTLNHIVALLHWGDCQVLSTASPDWRRAFRGRMVYDARVRSQSTEELFVVLSDLWTYPGTKYIDIFGETVSILSKKWALSLFSPRERRWYTLPPVPGCHSGMPNDCKYVLLDGAMYRLGGSRSGEKHLPCAREDVFNLATGHTLEWMQYIFSAEVHVLDLAAGHPLEWRRCANMQVPRRTFTVGVMHGKIFVFGGMSEGTCFENRNEMYDPKADAWSWVAPIIPSVSLDTACTVGPSIITPVDFQKVFSVGQAFFVCSGRMGSKLRGDLRPIFVSDHEAIICGDTKLVIEADCVGVPRLIYTSDDDAEDKMEDLHSIIENQLDGLGNGVERLMESPAECLQSYINYRDLGGSNLWAYDPVKDEWRVFEVESLGTDSVDMVQQTRQFNLAGGYDGTTVMVTVWAVRL